MPKTIGKEWARGFLDGLDAAVQSCDECLETALDDCESQVEQEVTAKVHAYFVFGIRKAKEIIESVGFNGTPKGK